VENPKIEKLSFKSKLKPKLQRENIKVFSSQVIKAVQNSIQKNRNMGSSF